MLQRFAAGIVFAVGDHQYDFLVQASIFLQVIGRGDYRVIQRGTAAGINLLQCVLELRDLIREVLVQIVLVVEINDKSLVFRVAGAHEIDGSLVHSRPLIAHGTGVINHDSDRHGNVLAMKRRDVLRDPILENLERSLVQIGHHATFRVVDGRM